MPRKRKYLLVAYGLDIILLLMLICVPYVTMTTTKQAGEMVGRTHAVRQQLSDVTSALHQVVVEQDHYLLTRNQQHLRNIAAKNRQLLDEGDELAQLVSDNPIQERRVQFLNDELQLFAINVVRNMELFRDGRRNDLTEIVAENESYSRLVNSAADKIDATEETLLDQRRQAFASKTTTGIGVTVFLGLLAAVGLLWLLIRFRRELQRREQLELDLINARASTEIAMKQKTQFLAAMSHEIRAPLGSIIGYAELLMEPSTSAEERQEYTMTILRNGRHLNQVVDDILDLSKIEAGALTIESIPCKPEEIVGEVIACLGQRARAKGIHLRAEQVGEPTPIVLSDPKILRQILLNLVGNAVKFTDRGEVVVRFRGSLEPDGKFLNLDFAVSDTGRGIADVDREKLFKEFSQGDAATGRLYGGTGLGLALSKNLARALKGDLELRATTYGKGSTFGFVLRAEVVKTRDIPKLCAVTPGGKTAAPAAPSLCSSLLGRHILLADDAPDNQLLIAEMLRAHGAKVDVVYDGIDAVQTALKHSYDVILMDIQMPHLDGYAATAQLRQRGYDRPILALSAHALKEERQKSIASGCNDHISKPVERLALVDAVARFCPSQASALH